MKFMSLLVLEIEYFLDCLRSSLEFTLEDFFKCERETSFNLENELLL